MNTSILKKLTCFLSILAVATLLSCGKKEPPADDPIPPITMIDMATAATISGTVKLDGPAPANKPIAMDADPVCKAAHANGVSEDHWVVGDGGVLANAFVYIKDGLGGKTYPPVGGD